MYLLQFPDFQEGFSPLSLIVGAIAGALYAGIAGVLSLFGTSEVIVTIMLNHTILQISNYLTNFVIGTGSRTEKVSENASLTLGWLTEITNYSRLNIGFFIAIVTLVIYWFS